MTIYARWLFGAAGVFNLAVGLGFLFLRPLFLGTLKLNVVLGTNIVVANLVGMFIALFGYAYLMAAVDPKTHRPYITLGAIGKLLAVTCGVVPWLAGEVSSTLPSLLAADLVFALLFLDYLRRTRPSTT